MKSKIITVDSKTHGLKSIQFKRQIESLVKQGVTTPILFNNLSVIVVMRDKEWWLYAYNYHLDKYSNFGMSRVYSTFAKEGRKKLH